MERMIFNREEFDRLYGCGFLSLEEWNTFAEPNILIGLLYLVPGILYLVLYIPFLIIMGREEFLKHSCYKLMFLLGFFDILGIILSAVIPGIQTFHGEVFCSNRIFNYVVGCFSTGMWGCTCTTCIILALNRTLDLAAPNISKRLFEGNRTFFWYIIPVLWGGYFILFSYPHVYTTIAFAFFFDPYYGMNLNGIVHDDLMRPHYVHSTNNIGTMLCLTTMYSTLCVFMIYKTKKLKGSVKITPTQKIMFIQCFLLCVITLTTASIYVTMQWIETPIWLIVIGQVTWQGAHGGAVLIYVILNKSLRKAMLQSSVFQYLSDSLFFKRFLKSHVSTIIAKSAEIHRSVKNYPTLNIPQITVTA